MNHRILIFALVTLAPVPLLGASGVLGGVWSVLALAYLTLFTFLVDELASIAAPAGSQQVEFPATETLSVALALFHFALMILAVAALSGATGLSGAERIVTFFAFGLFFGQVSNSNAHELIHRPQKGLRFLGQMVFISHLFGHHASAHPKIHHRYVGSDGDPNSASLGDSFYKFAPRAWIGSFKLGLREENRIWRAGGKSILYHPYFADIGGAILCLTLAGLLGRTGGILAFVALAGYATLQLLMSDYVQHYGLRRLADSEGRLVAVDVRHSWNAPHWFSNYLMLSAPRHSDHHAHPSKTFPELDLKHSDEVPTLPRSLPVMGFVALFPNWWRRVMDPRANQWSAKS